jgi:hypothetical protein
VVTFRRRTFGGDRSHSVICTSSFEHTGGVPEDRSELEAAIEDLYDAFAGYPRPPWFEGCGCCWGDGDAEPITDGNGHRGTVRVPSPGGSRPLRALTAEELSNVAAEVPLTAGTLDVLKHYLPRILEIAVGEGFDWPDLEIVLSRLNDDERVGSVPWTSWPEHEAEAIRAFLHALWRTALATDGDEYTVDGPLCGIGTVDPDIDWYLDEWLRFESPNAALNLERFLQLNLGWIMRGRLWNAYWDRKHAPARQNLNRIISRLRSPATKDAVAAAADRARTDGERDALTEVFLRWLP